MTRFLVAVVGFLMLGLNAGYCVGQAVAIQREYNECVKRFGPMVPRDKESCGSMIGAQHGEIWRREWP